MLRIAITTVHMLASETQGPYDMQNTSVNCLQTTLSQQMCCIGQNSAHEDEVECSWMACWLSRRQLSMLSIIIIMINIIHMFANEALGRG